MSLCFLEALTAFIRRENGITEQEYIQHLVAHFRGIRHPNDNIPSITNTLSAIYPWAGSLREIALESVYDPLPDTSTYETFFLACAQGDEPLLKTTLQALLTQEGPNVLQPAACLAAQKKNHITLKYLLEQGAVFDKYIEKAVQIGAVRSPEMLELMLEADCAGIRSSREAVERQIEYYGPESFEGKWLEEHAGKGGNSLYQNIARAKKLKGQTEREDDENNEGSSKKREKGGSGGRNASKGKGKGDQRQRITPDQIQKWFGDVPW